MKSLIRKYVANLTGVYFASLFIKGFLVNDGIIGLLIGAGILTLVNIFIKPILSLFLAPLNFLSFGLITWVVNGGLLYAITIYYPKLRLVPWHFSGMEYNGIIVPAADLNIYVTAIIAGFFISLISSLLDWLAK